jgi:protein-disulfide isomerase
MKMRARGILIILAVAVVGGGCVSQAPEGEHAPASKEPTPAVESGQEVVATVDGAAISAEALDTAAKAQLQKLMVQIYQVRKSALDGMIADMLIEEAAKAEGKSTEDYLAENVDAKVLIKKEELIASLREKADVKVMLEPPRTEVSLDGAAHTIGGEEAKIVLVEFSDYECPYSVRVQPTVRRILDEYKDKITYAFFDFPLPFHKKAMKAHEAARCAGEQGKYAEYGKKLFENQKKLGVEDLKKYAEDLELDAEAFASCLESGKASASTQQSVEKGRHYGVTGTPAFFINGIMISGAQPFKAFKEIIEGELAR